MRTKLLLAAAAALLSLNAGARDIGTERVTVVGTQLSHKPIAAMTFAGVQGEYQLDDGRRLSVTGKRVGQERTLYADLGQGPVEIVQVGKNRFAGAGQEVGITFDAYAGKHPESVRVSSSPR